MRCAMPLSMLLSLSILGLVSVTFANDASAEVACSGHKLLPIPRPQSSCSDVKPRIYPSPDGALRALVFPVDVSLYATPDMESRVVIRTSKGDTLTSKDYSSPRGANGYYVFNAKWSPDSQFFVYSMSSSGGHSPWSFPMMVYSRQKNRIAGFSDRRFREISILPARIRWSPARGSNLDRWMTRLRSRSISRRHSQSSPRLQIRGPQGGQPG